MSINVANDANKTPIYTGAAAALAGQPIVWGGFRVSLNGKADDDVVCSITDGSAGSFQGFYVARDHLFGGGPSGDGWQIYMADGASHNVTVNTGASSTAGVGASALILFAAEITSGTTMRVSVCKDYSELLGEFATYQASGTYTPISGGIAFSSVLDICLGKWNNSGGDKRQFNGIIEDFFFCTGSMPTEGEITSIFNDAVSIEAVKQAEASAWEIAFHPELWHPTLRDRIYTGVTPAVATAPAISLETSQNSMYREGSSISVVGDTQHLTDVDDLANAGSGASHPIRMGDAAAVFHVGDLVENALQAEFEDFRGNFYSSVVNENGIPFYFTLGNHDYNGNRVTNAAQLSTCMPVSLISGLPGYAAYPGNDYGIDKYCYVAEFVWASETWLFASLPCFALKAHADWIVTQCAANPEKKVLLCAHTWLNSSGELFDSVSSGSGEKNQFHPAGYSLTPVAVDPGGASGLWADSLAAAPNIALIVGGHDIYQQTTRKSEWLELTGDNGNRVLCVFVNDQDGTNGGNGHSCLIENDNGTLRGIFWKPVTDEVWRASDVSTSYFDWQLPSLIFHLECETLDSNVLVDSSPSGNSAFLVLEGGTPYLVSVSPGLGKSYRSAADAYIEASGPIAGPLGALAVAFFAACDNISNTHAITGGENGEYIRFAGDESHVLSIKLGEYSTPIDFDCDGICDIRHLNHYLITRDALGDVRLWINGVAQGVVGTQEAGTDGYFWVNKICSDSDANACLAVLDDFRIYNSLEDGDTLAPILAAQATSGNLLLLHCNETSGSALADSSGLGNDILLEGTPTLGMASISPAAETGVQFNTAGSDYGALATPIALPGEFTISFILQRTNGNADSLFACGHSDAEDSLLNFPDDVSDGLSLVGVGGAGIGYWQPVGDSEQKNYYHLSRDSDGLAALCVNGVLVDIEQIAVNALVVFNYLAIDGEDNGVVGFIDEIRISNQYESPAVAAAEYAALILEAGIPSGLMLMGIG